MMTLEGLILFATLLNERNLMIFFNFKKFKLMVRSIQKEQNCANRDDPLIPKNFSSTGVCCFLNM